MLWITDIKKFWNLDLSGIYNDIRNESSSQQRWNLISEDGPLALGNNDGIILPHNGDEFFREFDERLKAFCHSFVRK